MNGQRAAVSSCAWQSCALSIGSAQSAAARGDGVQLQDSTTGAGTAQHVRCALPQLRPPRSLVLLPGITLGQRALGQLVLGLHDCGTSVQVWLIVHGMSASQPTQTCLYALGHMHAWTVQRTGACGRPTAAPAAHHGVLLTAQPEEAAGQVRAKFMVTHTALSPQHQGLPATCRGLLPSHRAGPQRCSHRA